MVRSRALVSLLAAAALLACGGKEDELDMCGPYVEKLAVADVVYEWYLYPDLLPPVVDTSTFATAADLLDHMTAEAQRQALDRGWSFLTTATAATTYYDEGKAVGFGIGLLVRDPRTFVSQVYPGSAAAAAGFARGDEILRVGETAETLAAVTPATLGAALGPSTAGVTRAIEVLPAGATAPVVRVVTKGTFGLDPVPAVGGAGERYRIFDRGLKKLGYVALRTFVSTADAQLDQAFAAFKAAGVTDVVVDLRYNGGGLISTGRRLANLLGAGLGGRTMMQVTNSPLRSEFDEVDAFTELTSAVAPARVAFITTGASASASELVPNVLEPWRSVALVGARTYGKPVGQRGFRLRNCDTVLYLVSFKLENEQGDGEYFKLENEQGDGEYFGGLPDAPAEGLPAFSGPLCDAADDLLNPLGDPAEASTAAALAWLETGECPAPPAAKPGASGALRARARDAFPEAPAPTIAQRNLPGLF